MTDPAELARRLRENCVGHPNARIPWPHRILHEAAALIETQAREIAELRAAIVDPAVSWIPKSYGWDKRHATAIRRAQEPTDGR